VADKPRRKPGERRAETAAFAERLMKNAMNKMYPDADQVEHVSITMYRIPDLGWFVDAGGLESLSAEQWEALYDALRDGKQ
jgi:hypothetical protein